MENKSSESLSRAILLIATVIRRINEKRLAISSEARLNMSEAEQGA